MDKFCILENYTIKEALDGFETNGERVMIVRDEDSKVIGVVSEGDIIRALAADIDIHTQIRNIIQNSFLYLKEKDMDKAYRMFKNKRITLLPVIDDDFMLVDVITMRDIYYYLENRGTENRGTES